MGLYPIKYLNVEIVGANGRTNRESILALSPTKWRRWDVDQAMAKLPPELLNAWGFIWRNSAARFSDLFGHLDIALLVSSGVDLHIPGQAHQVIEALDMAIRVNAWWNGDDRICPICSHELSGIDADCPDLHYYRYVG